MPGQHAFHDRVPAVPDRDPTAALSDALDRLRLQGAIFLRGEYSESWAYESMTSRETAAVLAPGAERVVLFHVVSSGRCWVETDDGDRRWADPGDVIVLPYGDRHRMGGVADAELVSMRSLLTPPPWREMPVIRYGAGGAHTDVVCGYLTSDDPLFDPRMRALPPVFVVSPPPGPAREWVRASIDYALQRTTRVSADRIAAPPQLVQPLVTEVLKLHLQSAQEVSQGWIRGLHDPVVAPAMALIHQQPERKWTVAALAAAGHVSASGLDERFRSVLGVPPIRYLTGWRMHVARDLLSGTRLSLYAVARRVGYDSEEAFSRAFKRAHGVAPGAWRVAAG
ncbi:MAG: AraC family transcriptional regulator [Nocardioidaceae bacterium]|nr:AraC family transcriptional regulator [Nocardioidaceae bacterium]NUS52058.1 AraC family transcriptional regulator [Nocardioidaceae bacterium]